MKIAGRNPGVYEDVVAFPRPDGDFIFKLKAVKDFSVFDSLCPEPEPPKINYPDGRKGVDLEDPSYKIMIAQRNEMRWWWLHIQTLAETPGLTWEKINLKNPATFPLFMEELKESGFLDVEIIYLCNKIKEVNSLSDAKLEDAKNRFLSKRTAV